MAVSARRSELRKIRETLVREHFRSEADQECDVTLNTFDHPRYEIMPTGQVIDGPDEVTGYYTVTREAFPDQRHDEGERIVCERVYFDTATIALQLGIAPPLTEAGTGPASRHSSG
ncbi:hypothetical protein [Streptomyces corynorhini]|uniref:Nuclear transport factor 2 family protein n=1 Tax=Streptomyces corynorhini TaxID=2282652 RepID=A0A370AYU2_9ACTN|nr:hypothetical protein [Streptomyces corynorhini]RDG34758.1 hypothetical protein DVH02_28950 [Streptomyces corynorhini]